MENYIEVHINKPVYGSFVYIRDKYIQEARIRGKKLHITCPGAECFVTAQEWMTDAKPMDKVFLDPNRPMRLYGNSIIKFTDKKPVEKKMIEAVQFKMF